jgi:hypothetical protein
MGVAIGLGMQPVLQHAYVPLWLHVCQKATFGDFWPPQPVEHFVSHEH